jgi:simple sugar transport system substrate-binding protein
MGTSIPSVSRKYLADGSIDKIFFWDPALAGEAQLAAAQLLAEGKKIEAGTDLGVKGYNSLKLIEGATNAFAGDAAVVVDKNNVDQYNF